MSNAPAQAGFTKEPPLPLPSESVESYIVPVYRHPTTPIAALTGVVKDPVRATPVVFRSLTELEAILPRTDTGARQEKRRSHKRQR